LSDLKQLGIQTNIKAGLESGRKDGFRLLLDVLNTKLLESLNIRRLTAGEHKVTLGIPANWTDADSAYKDFKQFAEGVFSQAELVPDAAAAILGASWASVLPVHDGPQSWIVVDAGGASIRISLVKKEDGSLKPIVVDSFVGTWGGDDIDRGLRDNWFLPTYGERINESVRGCGDLLELLMRDFKENLIKGGFTRDEDYSALGIQEPVQLSMQAFEEQFGQVSRQQIREMLQDPHLLSNGWDAAESVLLVGGTTAWAAVEQEVKDRWPTNQVIQVTTEPDLLVVKGLVLASTDFYLKPNNVTLKQSPLPTEIIDAPPGVTPPPTPLQPKRDLQAVRQKVHKMVGYYALGCAAVALALAWLPFAAWPILMAIEVYMLLQVAKLYGYRYTNGLFISMTIVLLVASLVLSLLLAPITESILCVVKPVLAGLIAWGIGEGGIAILEWDSARAH
jgi:uncharacterized protein (DUF697 family)